MVDVEIIFRFFTYIILEYMIIQHIHMLSDYKVKNKIFTILFVSVNSAIVVWLLVSSAQIEKISVALSYIAYSYCLFSRFILYALVFRKCSFKILYIFIFVVATNQIYYNLIRKWLSNEDIKHGIAFLIEFIILAFVMIYTKKNNKEEVFRQTIASLPKKLYILILVMLLIASVFVMGETMKHHEVYEKYLLIPSMVGLVISTIAVIKIGISETEKKANIDLLSKQVEGQIGYYEKINKIYGEFRSFRHDYKNHVLCLRGLIAADKKDEALEYMNTMQDMSSVGKNKYHTGNVIIDALLDDKSDKAEKVNTKIDFEGVVPTSGISNADLCIIMANAIDNAIEACSKDESENKKSVKIDADFRQGYFFLRVSNPMFEEVKFKGKNKVATSKADKEHHGFGVANIVHTAEKYGGTAEISMDNGQFTIDVQLMLEHEYAEQPA